MAERGIWFRQARHTIRDCEVIEVWFNDSFLATICPPPRDSALAQVPVITIISKYLDPDAIIVDRREPALSLIVGFGGLP